MASNMFGSLPAVNPVWLPDRGDGYYVNPVLHADYSDPDAIRVGESYYLIASSFTCVPGIPVLQSSDLVNWRLINHALPRLVPEVHFQVPRHGGGVWAPSLRYHDGLFWIYYPDPDFGIYLITAKDPAGAWSKPVLVKGGKGLIDPCPLWDDDGRVYLVHGWAKSRAGISNVITLLELSFDGRSVVADFGFVIEGGAVDHPNFGTLEGPKFYRRNGWYYIFAPAGGVATGWQSVFRSRNVAGPYEHRIVLEQGETAINGPHQGALVDTPEGAWWFLHFQDRDAYGRIVHLEPVEWRNGWPVIGIDVDDDGIGNPVASHAKPAAGDGDLVGPAMSDDFGSGHLGLQWQWQANPQDGWHSCSVRPGWLRLWCQPEPHRENLYRAPYLLMQKFPANEFTVSTRLEFEPSASGGCAGLMVLGYDYAWVGLRAGASGLSLVTATATKAADDHPQVERVWATEVGSAVDFRLTVRSGAHCQYSYRYDSGGFVDVGDPFVASVGHWVGAKFGLFASSPAGSISDGWADFESIRVEPVSR
jgi:beta-xylosidase